MELDRIVSDFAQGMKLVDSKSPIALNARTKIPYRPGIGPHTETATVELVFDELEESNPALYEGRFQLSVPYPELPRQKCDVCIGTPLNWERAIEIKMLRILGDNGKPNDNILMHILSPYPKHRSALTDCEKLARSSLASRKAIMIYGYEADKWPLEPAITAFENLSRVTFNLGQRFTSRFDDLVHPVHKEGSVFGWELK